jgi:predicted unusual protein kinase regulating ubiquinone biosynthesis (AarF/ABC1/UbiB family)
MIRNGVFHKDAHYGNILLQKSGSIVWIDNHISPIRSKKDIKNLLKRFIYTDVITDSEIEKFKKEFGDYL